MSNNYSQIFIEDLIDYFEEDAVYVKFYKKKDPAFHKDGQIVYFNLVYALGLIDRLRANDPFFLKLFQTILQNLDVTEMMFDRANNLVIFVSFSCNKNNIT